MPIGYWVIKLITILIPSIILITLLIIIIGGIKQWISDNNSPRINTHARVMSKRTKITSRNSSNIHTSTIYYVTFELDSGDRAEFKLKGHEYGMLI